MRGLAGWPFGMYYTPIGGSFIILTGLYYRLTPILSSSSSLTPKALLTKQADSVTISSLYIFFDGDSATQPRCCCGGTDRHNVRAKLPECHNLHAIRFHSHPDDMNEPWLHRSALTLNSSHHRRHADRFEKGRRGASLRARTFGGGELGRGEALFANAEKEPGDEP